MTSIRPNLNRNQKGVVGLAAALVRSDGNEPIKVTKNGARECIYHYRGKGSACSISAHVDEKNNSVRYRWLANISGMHRVINAYDYDNDGNIDKYVVQTSDDDTEHAQTYINPQDDGEDNFIQVESKSFSWNPLDWFK